MTQTNAEALEAIRRHHRVLFEQVLAGEATLRLAASIGTPTEPARAALVVYLAEEVLPHAIAEEQTIYRAAAERGALAEMVAEMTAEHRTLAEGVERLAGATDPEGAVATADELVALLGAHIDRENDELLPAMIADDANLARLLGQMHDLIEDQGNVSRTAADADADHEREVLELLLDAAAKLAKAGAGDDACRIAAAAWAALYEPRPDLAARVTGALHRLTRLAGAGKEPCTCGHDHAGSDDSELDVRALAPAQRHQTIFAAYWHLDPGQGFVLVNDHDPKPLRYQFEAEHSGQFTWEVVESGPEVWRVRIGRPAAGDASAQSGDEPELDVRELTHGRRHDTIFAGFNALAPGAGFVLVNDHDPRPLRYQFEAQYPDRYSWEYLEAGPKVWRVRIGRIDREDGLGASITTDPELDVRQLMLGRRHDTIFTAFGRLIPGAGFVLVNDHDPRPLRFQLEAQYPDEYSWEYLEAGPEVWRVRIGRVESASTSQPSPAA